MGIDLKDIRVIQNMQSNTVSVDYDVSVLGMLRMDDPDNILVNGLDIIKKFRDMLLARLSRVDQEQVKIHVQPYLLNDTLDVFQFYLEQGAHIVLWHDDDMLLPRPSAHLTVVHTDHNNPIRREGFLVIRTPSLNRILAVWQDENNEITGVLITNPSTAETVGSRLDTIIRSNTH